MRAFACFFLYGLLLVTAFRWFLSAPSLPWAVFAAAVVAGLVLLVASDLRHLVRMRRP